MTARRIVGQALASTAGVALPGDQPDVADTEVVDCRAIGDTIQIRAPRKFLNPNHRPTLNMFFATILIVEDHMRGVKDFNKISSFIQKSVIIDYTGVTAVTPITRELSISPDE